MTSAHLDHDALADLAEGLLDDVAATSAEQHLTGCDGCRNRAAEVAEVSRVLAEAPLPPMPAHLVDRLDAAIAAEAATHASGDGRSYRFHYIAAAAAAVVVVGGGAIVAGNTLKNTDSKNANGSQAPVQEPSRSTGRGSGTKPNVAPRTYQLIGSGTNYTAANLPAQVTAAMRKGDMSPKFAPEAPPAALNQCVTRASREKGGGRAPLLVDRASYEGRPATVIVLPGTDDMHLTAVVVGPNCSAGNLDLRVNRQVGR